MLYFGMKELHMERLMPKICFKVFRASQVDKTGTKRIEVLFFHLRGGHQVRISMVLKYGPVISWSVPRVTLACVAWQGFSVTFLFCSSLSWCLSFISQFVFFMFRFYAIHFKEVYVSTMSQLCCVQTAS